MLMLSRELAFIIHLVEDCKNYEFQLTTIEKEKLIELSYDSSLKQKFQNDTIIQFWMNLCISNQCKCFYLFVTSYSCETNFSALAATKSKYRTRLIVEKELRMPLSTLPPRFDKLSTNKQQQPSR
ncbi:SCAN domain-containing protein 3 [Anthophora plagiata]